MRCKEFDTHIDEMLSGVLHPDANEHMRQCERCTSYYRARTAVQNGLSALAAGPAAPSRATDRAVMESYRRLQERRLAAAQAPKSAPRPAARLFTFPSRGAAARGSRHHWPGVAVAAMLLAMLGSGLRLWVGTSAVSSPNVSAPPAVATTTAPSVAERIATVAKAVETPRRPSLRMARLGKRHEGESDARLIEAKAEMPENGSAVATQQSAGSIMHLASSGGAGLGQAASSTWPGYDNLMYCDPVTCSGPMEVVHIQVPADQAKPSSGKSTGKSFVNADVLVGPDGVARAIRVAN